MVFKPVDPMANMIADDRTTSIRENPARSTLTLPEMFRDAVAQAPESIAVVTDTQSHSWRQWQVTADAIAYGLQQLGIGAGDIVAVQLPNSFEFLAVHVAVAAIGGVLLPVPVDCGWASLGVLLARTEPKVLIVVAQRRDRAGASMGGGLPDSVSAVEHLLVAGCDAPVPGSLEWLVEDCAGRVPSRVDVRPEQPLVLIGSSGATSKRPKICVHSHGGVLSNAAAVLADSAGAVPGDTVLSASAFSFLFGLLSVHISILARAKQAICRTWDKAGFIATAVQTSPTVLFAVPTQLHDVLTEIRAGVTLPRLRQVRTGGSMVPANLVVAVSQLLADQVIVQWGSSEIGAGTCTRPEDPLELASHTVGRPIGDAQVRVTDADDRPCTTGQIGSLQFRSPDIFGGYFRDPESTEQALTADGWLRTGDLASIDADGVVRLHGRSMDIINVGGRKVNTIELESLMADFVATEDVVVVGRRDSRLGEVPVLVCTTAAARTVSLDAVTAHLLAKGVAPYQLPVAVIGVDQLPHTPTGKIARWRVREIVEKKRAASVPPGNGLSSSDRERLTSAIALVCDLAEQLIGTPVTPDATFGEQGFDSSAGVRLCTALTTTTGLDLPDSLIFDYPTPRAVARFLLGWDRDRQVAQPAAVGRTDEPVAVVGMACRFPGGVDSAQALWDLVAGGIDAVGGFPGDRGWDLGGLFDPDPDALGKTYTRAGAFLPDVAGFDAEFFGISAREARVMDPQQRLLLEVCWEALETAGIDPAGLAGSDSGVFVGAWAQSYGDGGSDSAEGYALTGLATSVASGRVAYVLGLQGPAITVDTACSSSLVATHLAGQSLRNGECSLALAGGVTVMTTPTPFIEFARQRGLAADGRCKPFAAAADGTGWGEGAGVLVLERLSDARANNHRVLAVIAGSAINQDGASNGLTAPNGPSQQRVIRQAVANAGIGLDQVDVIEAHGTGTTLGDPIEANALIATYGASRDPEHPLWLGSVKSNIGHTQAAAGVAGLIKMIEALNHDILPPTLHVDQPSPRIDWSAGALRLLTEALPWPLTGHPKTAAVSSFGISGTNAHVIVQQAPTPTAGSAGPPQPGSQPPAEPAAPPPLLVWPISAGSPKALAAQADRLHKHLTEHPDVDVIDVAYSLASTRTHHPYRAAITTHSHTEDPRQDLLDALDALTADLPHPRLTRHHSPAHQPPGETVFVLPGQGAQYPGMGLDLYRHHRTFARTLDEVCEALDAHLEVSLRDVMFAQPGSTLGELLHQTAYTQPALFAMGAAMHALFVEAGIIPDYLLGHSIGELTAAYLAGVFSLADAAVLVTARGRLMQACPPGAMIAVQANERDVVALLKDHPTIAIAAVNGPTSVVVSGHPDELEPIRDYCAAHDLRVKSLSVSRAFHSSLMDPAVPEFEAIAAGLTSASPTVPIVSNLTGQPATSEQLTSSRYWARHLRETVRFHDSVAWLLGAGEQVFVELSPHPVLAAAITDTLAGTPDRAGSAVITTLHRDRPDLEAIASTLVQLHNHGHSPSWRSLYPHAHIVALPTYAFQHRRYWVTPSPAGEVSGPAECALWKAVDDEAVDTVAQVLGITDAQNGAALGAVVRALRKWRSDLGVRSAANKLRYRVGWQGVTLNTFPATRRRWLVLAFPEQADDVWITGLSARYAEAVEVLTVELSELRRNSLSALLTTAAGRAHCDGIVSFLATDERAHRDFSGISVGLLSTLLVAQAHCDADLGIPLWVITQGGVCVSTDDGAGSPSQSAAWGLGQSVCLEHPDQWGGLIDLPPSATPHDIEHLYAILTCPQSEDQLAIRRHGVSARRLFEAPLPLERVERANTWKPSGTALVTGATGRLGKHVAGWLAESGANPVVLLSRNAAQHPQSAELEKELHTRGVVATAVSVDVTDRSALAAVLADIRRAHGPIRTVVHAAAAIGWNTISDTTAEEFSNSYAVKAVGADNLVELLEDEPPDTFILFSSAAGTWGGARQACYAAANAHIDALAARLRRNGCRALSAAFGAWADETASSQQEVLDYFQRIGINQIAPTTALAALQQAIEANDSLITIADVSWDRFVPAFTARRSQPLLTEFASRANTSATGSSAPTAGAESLREKLAGQTAEQQLDTVTTLVAAATATVLAHPDARALDTDLPFKDLGIDSLTALELRNALATHTGLTLRATLVFDYSTPAALAKYLTGLLTDTVGPVLGPIGQLLETAFSNGERTTLVDIIIAASGLHLGQDESPNGLTATNLTSVDDASARLVCLSEFPGQYQTFATGIQENIQLTEIITPGFSGTLPPPTAEYAAEAIIDALEASIPGDQTLVIAGHGVTCIPALHTVKLLRQKIRSTGAKPPRLAMVFIAPVTTHNTCTISADPLLFQAISAHLHSEGDLIAYGRYLRFGMQSPEALPDDRLLTIHPRTGKHILTPVSPLVLEPALTALSISNWINEFQWEKEVH